MFRALGLVFAAMVLSAGCASNAAPSAAAPPVWRKDTSHLSADLRDIHSCFVSAAQHTEGVETQCMDIPRSNCQAEIGEEAASTTGGMRMCNWRAIAAWEDVLAESITALRAKESASERKAFDAAQSAWAKFLAANVIAHSDYVAGGTLSNVVAGAERARMNAERALEVRRMIADLGP